MAPAKRRAAGALASLALGVGLGACAGEDEGTPAAGPRNIVVVLTDDQDVASLDVMPNVGKLIADQGLEFTNSYATTPECCPSRATLLTGQYAHNHGVVSAEPPNGGYGALNGSETLPVWLTRAGYRTAFVGKYLNGYGSEAQGNDRFEVPPGWSDWYAATAGTEHEMYDYELNENGEIITYGAEADDYLTDVLSQKATGVVADASSEADPFLLIVAPLAPHGEGSLEGTGAVRDPRPAPRHLGKFDELPAALADPESGDQPPAALAARVQTTRRRIAAGELEAVARGRLESLLAVDEMVADLVAELRAAETLDETVFIFTSDNGFLLGEHGLLGKELPYEESARVPLIVSGPGFPGGETSEQLVANIDLAPTIVDLASAEPELEFDGTSLLPFAEGEIDPERELVIEYLVGSRRYEAIRSRDLLYARYAQGGEQLFDLATDPRQLDNLAADADQAETVTELAARLDVLSSCAGESCR